MHYEHPTCTAQGMIDSARLEAPVSGHQYIQVAGDRPSNAVLCCQVCGVVSNGNMSDDTNRGDGDE